MQLTHHNNLLQKNQKSIEKLENAQCTIDYHFGKISAKPEVQFSLTTLFVSLSASISCYLSCDERALAGQNLVLIPESRHPGSFGNYECHHSCLSSSTF